ncbi:methyltransferase domain-containing protein [Actinomyces sp. 186855]|nr:MULTISPECIES: class I SAM-dependent methyltransferase [unclassified Actinomyces]MCL3777993.1 methyltransferase domain-containing protein [Actinomyces sp. AC-20-1]MCL3789620.1 methyltransferase domain-containing protein [Actinomyces sp. 187325]MCL3791990.1 methyltransferase domain-containing protein [Actinomyces sp. 186855]MCL3794686.1 methyltransferase domain-containing protein [Actinomyces sp. 217892]
MQGHWLLAVLGKRVLRPGGIALTRRMLDACALQPGQRLVELGPGVGRTAELLLATRPSSYRGVDPHPEGREQVAAVLDGHPEAAYVVADASRTGLPGASADLVVGEAMLTMQPDAHKREIVAEATRLLAPGGRYAIHELALRGDLTDSEVEATRKEISRAIRVGARPLTVAGWSRLLTEAGLVVEWSGTAPMHLLEPRRLVQDEGLIGAARFVVRMVRTPGARERVRSMRWLFRLRARALTAVALVARKPAEASEPTETTTETTEPTEG